MKTRPGVLIAAGTGHVVSCVKRSLPLRHGLLLVPCCCRWSIRWLRAEVLAAETPPGFKDRAVVTVYGEPYGSGAGRG